MPSNPQDEERLARRGHRPPPLAYSDDPAGDLARIMASALQDAGVRATTAVLATAGMGQTTLGGQRPRATTDGGATVHVATAPEVLLGRQPGEEVPGIQWLVQAPVGTDYVDARLMAARVGRAGDPGLTTFVLAVRSDEAVTVGVRVVPLGLTEPADVWPTEFSYGSARWRTWSGSIRSEWARRPDLGHAVEWWRQQCVAWATREAPDRVRAPVETWARQIAQLQARIPGARRTNPQDEERLARRGDDARLRTLLAAYDSKERVRITWVDGRDQVGYVGSSWITGRDAARGLDRDRLVLVQPRALALDRGTRSLPGTWQGLARRFGVQEEALRAANRLTDDEGRFVPWASARRTPIVIPPPPDVREARLMFTNWRQAGNGGAGGIVLCLDRIASVVPAPPRRNPQDEERLARRAAEAGWQAIRWRIEAARGRVLAHGTARKVQVESDCVLAERMEGGGGAVAFLETSPARIEDAAGAAGGMGRRLVLERVDGGPLLFGRRPRAGLPDSQPLSRVTVSTTSRRGETAQRYPFEYLAYGEDGRPVMTGVWPQFIDAFVAVAQPRLPAGSPSRAALALFRRTMAAMSGDPAWAGPGTQQIVLAHAVSQFREWGPPDDWDIEADELGRELEALVATFGDQWPLRRFLARANPQDEERLARREAGPGVGRLTWSVREGSCGDVDGEILAEDEADAVRVTTTDVQALVDGEWVVVAWLTDLRGSVRPGPGGTAPGFIDLATPDGTETEESSGRVVVVEPSGGASGLSVEGSSPRDWWPGSAYSQFVVGVSPAEDEATFYVEATRMPTARGRGSRRSAAMSRSAPLVMGTDLVLRPAGRP